MNIKIMTDAQTNTLLSELDMELGEWGQIYDKKQPSSDPIYTGIRASDSGKQLFVLALHCVTWFAKSGWLILRFDKSSSLSSVQSGILSALLFERRKPEAVEFYDQSILIEIQNNEASIQCARAILVTTIYFVLLFETHAEIVSSESGNGRFLSMQDGHVYFMHREDDDRALAKSIASEFTGNPDRYPREFP